MVSKSYSNLLELASGESPTFGRIGRGRMPRIMTVAGLISDVDDDKSESVCSEVSSSSVHRDRIIIVANQLPIRAQRKEDSSKGWIFSWDENSLLLQLKDGLGDDEIEVIYVGCLKEDIHPNEQDEVSQILLETFKCVPTFLPPELFSRYYHGFCKQQLWPLFHYMLPLSPDLGGRFNRSLWQAYVSVNKIFADRIMEVINPEDDFVWIHDYHLMVLPTFLRKRFNRVKLGFFQIHFVFVSHQSLPAATMSSVSYLAQARSHQSRRKSHQKIGFRKRCVMMAKHQKTRFYILGRCVSMLLCWHDHSISD